MEGVDYSFSRPDPACLKRNGKDFAVRYTSIGPSGKNLTASEVVSLTAAGLSVVVVFEEAAGHMLGGYDAGVQAARASHDMAMAAGMPPGRPHYFALDIDPNQLTVKQAAVAEARRNGTLVEHTPFDARVRMPNGTTTPVNLAASQWDACTAYLNGAASVLGREAVGLYGGYTAIERLCPGVAPWAWQTYAWSGGRISLKNHLYQYQNNQSMCGGTVDLTRAFKPDFGQWGRGLPEDIILDAASKAYFDKQFELLRIGDQAGGAFDSHDFSSVEGVGKRVMDANKKLDQLLTAFQALTDAVTGGTPVDVPALAAVLGPAVANELALRLGN